MSTSYDGWPELRSGLVAVRDVVRKQNRRASASAAEGAALAKVARHPAFADIGPDADEEARGRWIVTAVRRRLEGASRPAREEAARIAVSRPDARAVVGWWLMVDQGLFPLELIDRHSDWFADALSGADTRIARRNRIQHSLWLGGNRGDKDAAGGIRVILDEMSSLGSDDAAETGTDATGFGYAWDRLGRIDPLAQDLLRMFSVFAPERDVSRRLLVDGRDPLPGGLREAVERTVELKRMWRLLDDHALVGARADRVRVPAQVQRRTWESMHVDEQRRWVGVAVRLIKTALPAETHHYVTWSLWTEGYHHLMSIVRHAEESEVLLGDLPYLLDRASVYQREALRDPATAIDLAERGLRISDQLGRPAANWHAYLLGNLAMALDDANDLPAAIGRMRECLEFEKVSLGSDTDEHANSLGIFASMLQRSGRLDEAAREFERALEIITDAYGDNPTDYCRGKFVEILNDYGSFLAFHKGGKKAVARAEGLLKQGYALVRPGEHGWTAININLAELHQKNLEFKAAENILRPLLAEVRAARPEPNVILMDILINLSKACRELGKLDEADRLWREAHEVDDAITEMRGGYAKDGQSYEG